VADRGTKGWLNELAEETDAKESASVKGKAGSKSGAEDGKPDPVVEAVKKDPKLSKHEQKIIGTIVDPNLIRDSFSDVHLPDKTVDAIRSVPSLLSPSSLSTSFLTLVIHSFSSFSRSVVSLPLLFPEAFSTGSESSRFSHPRPSNLVADRPDFLLLSQSSRITRPPGLFSLDLCVHLPRSSVFFSRES